MKSKTRRDLTASLKHRKVRVDDLHEMMPYAISTAVEDVRKEVDNRLNGSQSPKSFHCPLTWASQLPKLRSDQPLISDGERSEKLRATHLALFGASWWPYADLERLRYATYLAIWVRTARLQFI